MKKIIFLFTFLFFILPSSINCLLAQNNPDKFQEKNYFATLNLGVQISGIKSEDFVSFNYSPLLIASLGKWFTRDLALQFGYKGWYFNTISDDKKHPYGYYFGEAIFNLNSIFSRNHYSKSWSIHIHLGSGYFYNYDYDRPNICANTGFSANLRISDRLYANMNIAAILGWDIYQGDEDILPGASGGISYYF